MPSTYQFVLCPNAACSLRFPGEIGISCPLCKTPTHLAQPRLVQPRFPPSTHSNDRASREFALLLDNVRSVFNVGSIFRTADGCGASEIFLCGITPTPEHSAMDKTALGAQKTVPWQQHNNGLTLAQRLVERGRVLWALEVTQDSTDLLALSPVRPPNDLVLVFGNEVTGVDPGILALCQRTLHIPMRGHKQSLNVATAAGIAAYVLSS